jgi:DNA-directed RNA polymerase specialized sigma24 family protein
MNVCMEALIGEARTKLWRAFLGTLGSQRAEDALSEALAWAWEHQERLLAMDNPIGYLYRVGVTRSTIRPGPPALPAASEIGLPDFEPRLIPALLTLTTHQRTAVWLIHGCGWTYPDAASAMGVGESTAGTHASRGLANLQEQLVKEQP